MLHIFECTTVDDVIYWVTAADEDAAKQVVDDTTEHVHQWKKKPLQWADDEPFLVTLVDEAGQPSVGKTAAEWADELGSCILACSEY